uniref:Uncharacterized protein n=1 Tax=Setaria viridis TaxID=4556 RepID=A0A4U6V8J6_SETVI|nr:hypothetical protein SEVIR_3G023550v2 [Setaria viridis]
MKMLLLWVRNLLLVVIMLHRQSWGFRSTEYYRRRRHK